MTSPVMNWTGCPTSSPTVWRQLTRCCRTSTAPAPIPNILRDAAGAYWAIDFGACLLINRLARGDTRPQTTLPANHLLAGRRGEEAVRGLTGLIDTAVPQRTIDALPDDWLADIGLPRAELFQRLTNYLFEMNLE